MTRATILLSLVLLLASCAAVPQRPAGADDADTVRRMGGLLDAGIARIEEGSIAEGARQLVATLAERRKLSADSPDSDVILRSADAELGKLAASLALDPGPEWLDEAKNQRAASVLDVGSPRALQPGVIVTCAVGRGRILVPGLPVVFAFVRGSGTLSGRVLTNDYGQASCLVSSLDDRSAEHVVRASVEIAVDGFTYRFAGLERDFTYAPPSRRAAIIAMERSPAGRHDPPLALEAAWNGLAGVSLDLSHFEGGLDVKLFAGAFAGEPSAIASLGVAKDVSYLVAVLSECTSVNQVVLEGKAYNIYASRATVTVRVIRIADGTVLYTGVASNVAGQGGSAEKAIADGLAAAARDLQAMLQHDLGAINAALAKGN